MRYLDHIERIAAASPERIAIRTSQGRCLTYGELWTASGALAVELASRVEHAAPVMVYGNKHPLMVACFIACMRAGCPYVPVDCFSVPAERVASIAGQLAAARDGRALLVLATEAFPRVPDLPEIAVIGLGEFERIVDAAGQSARVDRARAIAGEDLAYILFTSGSTGAPKGVQVTAACFDNFCDWDVELASDGAAGTTSGAEGAANRIAAAAGGAVAAFTPGDAAISPDSPASADGAAASDAVMSTPSTPTPRVWLDQPPFSFDLSVFELAGALACGDTLFSLDHATQQSMASQLAALAESQVSVWVSTPSFAEMCLASPEFSAELLPLVRVFLFCGETLPNATAARLMERFPAARVVNTYGPTESTVAVTAVDVTPALAASSEPLPVGLPRPGTRLRVVNAAGEPCGPGEPGEVIIEGDTVAAGYFGRPDLTARAFGEAVLDARAVRSYRTGDEGYLDEAGMLHFRGRLDLQVKLNGFRIELGDIEEHLRRLPEVAAACVVPAVREGRASHLVAYVVGAGLVEGSAFRAGLALKDQLKASLPHYMIPKKVVFLEALPMTGNGKVDRRSLTDLASTRPTEAREARQGGRSGGVPVGARPAR